MGRGIEKGMERVMRRGSQWRSGVTVTGRIEKVLRDMYICIEREILYTKGKTTV